MAFAESHPRTFLKTVVYRIVLIATNSLVIFAFTRRIDITLGSIGVLAVFNTLLYYLYERIWNNVHWGKNKLIRRKRKKG